MELGLVNQETLPATRMNDVVPKVDGDLGWVINERPEFVQLVIKISSTTDIYYYRFSCWGRPKLLRDRDLDGDALVRFPEYGFGHRTSGF